MASTLVAGKNCCINSLTDDTGLFLKATKGEFAAVCSAVNKYECVSGAKLNIDKSVIIQLDNLEQPDWIERTSCRIAAKGEVVTYQGCPIGNRIRPTKETEFLLGKVKKRLRNWMNRTLTQAGRLVLLKHDCPSSHSCVPSNVAQYPEDWIQATRKDLSYIPVGKECYRCQQKSVGCMGHHH